MLEHLGRSGYLARFRSLSVLGADDGDSAAHVLSSHDAALTELVMTRCELSDDGATAIAEVPGLTSVQCLELSGNFVSDPGVRALARTEWPSLRKLGLGDNEISDAGARALASAPGWPALEELDLQRNFVEDDGALALLGSAERARLRVLLLASNPLGSAGRLAHAQWRAV